MNSERFYNQWICDAGVSNRSHSEPVKIFLPFFFFLTFVYSAPILFADTIILQSGQIVEGRIIERTDRAVQIDVGVSVPITYYSDQIKKISQAPAVTPMPVKSSPETVPPQTPDSVAQQADRKEQQGLGLIDLGQMDDGLELLREAVRLDPQANRHLNLGSILVGNGVALQKKGESAAQIFQEAEAELQAAIKGFDPNGETTFISEAYNLLGEMYTHALNDPVKARGYFEKSLSFYENPAAKRALAELP